MFPPISRNLENEGGDLTNMEKSPSKLELNLNNLHVQMASLDRSFARNNSWRTRLTHFKKY